MLGKKRDRKIAQGAYEFQASAAGEFEIAAGDFEGDGAPSRWRQAFEPRAAAANEVVRRVREGARVQAGVGAQGLDQRLPREVVLIGRDHSRAPLLAASHG